MASLAALLRPDRFRGVIGLRVPYRPRGQARPTTVMPQTEDAVFYQLYFQTRGWPKPSSSAMYVRPSAARYWGSGDSPRQPDGGPAELRFMVPRGGVSLARWPNPAALPPWLSESDLGFYVGEITRTVFRGGLDWDRNIDRNWKLLALFAGSRVSVPEPYIAGDRDLGVLSRMEQLIPNVSTLVPQLRATIMLSGCGHWRQQERAQEVGAAMIQFLRGL